jgi:hypothetical protein
MATLSEKKQELDGLLNELEASDNIVLQNKAKAYRAEFATESSSNNKTLLQNDLDDTPTPRVIVLYKLLKDLNEIFVNYTSILNDPSIMVESDEYHDDFLLKSVNITNALNASILEYNSEYESYVNKPNLEKEDINIYVIHIDLALLYNKNQLFPNVLDDVAEVRDIILSYKKVQPLVESFTQYRNSTLLEDEIKVHIKSGNTFTSEKMDLLKEYIAKCEDFLDVYHVANFHIQERYKTLINTHVIKERDMLVNDFLPVAERAWELSTESQGDLKDELYLHKLDRIKKNPELPDGVNAVYKESPIKELYAIGTDSGIQDIDEVSANDIKQSSHIGDCFFLAALGSLAKANPATIKNMLKDNKNGTYTVTLHLIQEDGRRIAKDIIVTNEMLYDNNGNLVAAQAGDGELWVMIIEKAYAKAMGGYDNIEDGGLGSEAIEVLTGRSSSTTKITSPIPSNFWTNLQTGLNNSVSITIATLKHSNMKRSRVVNDILNAKGEVVGIEEGSLKVFAGHLYMLDAVDVANKTIDLRNPHGNNHIKNLSAIQLEDYFENYQEC